MHCGRAAVACCRCLLHGKQRLTNAERKHKMCIHTRHPRTGHATSTDTSASAAAVTTRSRVTREEKPEGLRIPLSTQGQRGCRGSERHRHRVCLQRTVHAQHAHSTAACKHGIGISRGCRSRRGRQRPWAPCAGGRRARRRRPHARRRSACSILSPMGVSAAAAIAAAVADAIACLCLAGKRKCKPSDLQNTTTLA